MNDGLPIRSAELHEIKGRERTARKLDQPAADGERSKVDAEKAEAFDQSANVRFGSFIVTGIK